MKLITKEEFYSIFTPGNIRSIGIDFTIVLFDFILAFVMVNYLGMTDEDRMLIVFGIPFLICVGLYVAGLFLGAAGIARGFFGESENDNTTAGLVFNSFLLGSFVFATVMTGGSTFISILVLFAFAAGWFYLHWRIIKKSSKENHTADKRFRLAAALMMYPLMICLVVFTSMLSSFITNVHDLKGNIVMIFLMMFVTWAISYVPRRFVKAMLNVKMTEGYFMIFLLIDYSLKVIMN